MRKILSIFGIFAVAAASADAAPVPSRAPSISRLAPVASQSNIQLSGIIRASAGTPAVATTPAAPTAAAIARVANPNTGNVLDESLLPDGTTLYTDPVSGERFVMSAAGDLVVYLDENDRIVQALNISVGDARNICQSITTRGYKGEFNELTFECSVPVAAIGTDGLISNDDGDAVAYYPFGSVIRCDADTFDNISVMRRNSQYIVPALVVGGGLAGAGIGFAYDKITEDDKPVDVASGGAETNAATTGQGNTAVAVSGVAVTAGQGEQAQVQLLVNQLKKDMTAFVCQGVPAKIAADLAQIKNEAGKSANIDCSDESYYLECNFAQEVVENIELFKVLEVPSEENECVAAKKFQTALGDQSKITMKPNLDGKVNVSGFSINSGGIRIGSDVFQPVTFGVDGSNVSQINAIVLGYYKSMAKITNELNSGRYALTSADQQVVAMTTNIIVEESAKKEKSFWGKYFGSERESNVLFGATIGAGVGAVGGIAYFFYEGANTECEVGDFKKLDLDQVYRMPSFREFIQTRPVPVPVAPAPAPVATTPTPTTPTTPAQ